MNYVIIICILFILIENIGAQRRCPSNEIFLVCNNRCADTCEDIELPSQPCSLDCSTPGCYCQPGFFRNRREQCVRPHNCNRPVTNCSENEIYLECGSSCPITCENIHNPPEQCDAVCIRGCFCRPGLYRNSFGSCVTRDACNDRRCPSNEIFLACNNRCADTCADIEQPSQPCRLDCTSPGCYCQAGFFRNRREQCVRPDNCNRPATNCSENEIYSECGSACPITCENIDNPPEQCDTVCIRGCFCRPGLYRNSFGRCVTREACNDQLPSTESPAPTNCSENEIYLECGSACPITCENIDNPPGLCLAVCIRGCFCRPDFYRNSFGRCVTRDACDGQLPSTESPVQICAGPNESFSTCVNKCNDCDRKGQCPSPVLLIDCTSGCDCIAGFFRNDIGICVPNC